MSEHAGRFTGRVEEYARYRRAYPAEQMLGWLRAECGLLPEWRVADVAAGTGMLTEVFLRNGNRVTAVEPNAEMRAACSALQERWPELRLVEGTAERTGLEAGAAEMVTAGRAFHWFEPEAAAAEFRRVVVPGGWVVLVASGRKTEDSERSREFEAMLVEYGTDREYSARRRMRETGPRVFLERLSGGAAPKRVIFEEDRRVSLEELRGMVQSVSCAPLQGDVRYAGMQGALEAFFARWSEGGSLPWTETCVVEAAQVG